MFDYPFFRRPCWCSRLFYRSLWPSLMVPCTIRLDAVFQSLKMFSHVFKARSSSSICTALDLLLESIINVDTSKSFRQSLYCSRQNAIFTHSVRRNHCVTKAPVSSVRSVKLYILRARFNEETVETIDFAQLWSTLISVRVRFSYFTQRIAWPTVTQSVSSRVVNR